MRPYNKSDFWRLYKYLESEGIPPLEMVFARDVTWVNDYGFYTYRLEHHDTQPWLIHFYIHPDHRGYQSLYRMYQHFKGEIRKQGFNWYVVSVPDDKQYIRKFVKLGGGNKYARKNKMDFYKVILKEA